MRYKCTEIELHRNGNGKKITLPSFSAQTAMRTGTYCWFME